MFKCLVKDRGYLMSSSKNSWFVFIHTYYYLKTFAIIAIIVMTYLKITMKSGEIMKFNPYMYLYLLIK